MNSSNRLEISKFFFYDFWPKDRFDRGHSISFLAIDIVAILEVKVQYL